MKKSDLEEIVTGDGFNSGSTRLTLQENMEGVLSAFSNHVHTFVREVDDLAMKTIARNVGLLCVLPGLFFHLRVLEQQVEAERAHNTCMELVASNLEDFNTNSYLRAAGVQVKFAWEGAPLFGRGAGSYGTTRTPKLTIEYTKPK
jgi:hypothetical protein